MYSLNVLNYLLIHIIVTIIFKSLKISLLITQDVCLRRSTKVKCIMYN